MSVNFRKQEESEGTHTSGFSRCNKSIFGVSAFSCNGEAFIWTRAVAQTLKDRDIHFNVTRFKPPPSVAFCFLLITVCPFNVLDSLHSLLKPSTPGFQYL